MRLFSKILWFFAFLAATFCWMVLFEHGFSAKSFGQGVREEWRALVELVTGKAGAPDRETPTPKSPPRN